MSNRFLHTSLVCLVLVFSACTAPSGDVSEEVVTDSDDDSVVELDLSGVSDYALGNAEMMKEATAKLVSESQAYFELIESYEFDYQAAYDAEGGKLVGISEDIKALWLEASTYYELDEGIVAGVPTLADYDVWIDAGPSKEEDPVEAREWTLEIADGRSLESPGNFFHSLLEPTIWGTNEEYSALKVDFDDDGAVEVGESLPEAYMLVAATKGLDMATAEMLEAIDDWEANLLDVFTALVTMIPTMNEYFGQWEVSYFIAGEGSDEAAFVAVSRLADIKGILNGLSLAYENVSELVAGEDEMLDEQIAIGFAELVEYVNALFDDEQAGKVFAAEEASQFGAEAQAMADVLTAQVAQAAELLSVEVE